MTAFVKTMAVHGPAETFETLTSRCIFKWRCSLCGKSCLQLLKCNLLGASFEILLGCAENAFCADCRGRAQTRGIKMTDIHGAEGT